MSTYRRSYANLPMKVRRRQSDARWRANVASCYETLKHIIPINKRASKRQISKALILQETAKHIHFLENIMSTLLQEKACNVDHLPGGENWCKDHILGVKKEFINKQRQRMELLNHERKHRRHRCKAVPPAASSSPITSNCNPCEQPACIGGEPSGTPTAAASLCSAGNTAQVPSTLPENDNVVPAWSVKQEQMATSGVGQCAQIIAGIASEIECEKQWMPAAAASSSASSAAVRCPLFHAKPVIARDQAQALGEAEVPVLRDWIPVHGIPSATTFLGDGASDGTSQEVPEPAAAVTIDSQPEGQMSVSGDSALAFRGLELPAAGCHDSDSSYTVINCHLGPLAVPIAVPFDNAVLDCVVPHNEELAQPAVEAMWKSRGKFTPIKLPPTPVKSPRTSLPGTPNGSILCSVLFDDDWDAQSLLCNERMWMSDEDDGEPEEETDACKINERTPSQDGRPHQSKKVSRKNRSKRKCSRDIQPGSATKENRGGESSDHLKQGKPRCRRSLETCFPAEESLTESRKSTSQSDLTEFDGYMLFYKHMLCKLEKDKSHAQNSRHGDQVGDGTSDKASKLIYRLWQELTEQQRLTMCTLVSSSDSSLELRSEGGGVRQDKPSEQHTRPGEITLSEDLKELELKPIPGLGDLIPGVMMFEKEVEMGWPLPLVDQNATDELVLLQEKVSLRDVPCLPLGLYAAAGGDNPAYAEDSPHQVVPLCYSTNGDSTDAKPSHCLQNGYTSDSERKVVVEPLFVMDGYNKS